MINIKPNQILKHKNIDQKYKVIEVLTQSAILQPHTLLGNSDIWTFEEIEGAFELPKEKWKPELGEMYYYPNLRDKYNCPSVFWAGDEFDQRIYEQGLVCKTREEAEALTEKMLKAINE